jgi:RimJ/RimL family protein N-acetyltransferase
MSVAALHHFCLHTSRLEIRPYTARDATALFSMVERNREILAFTNPQTVKLITSVWKARRYIAQKKSERQLGTTAACGIFLRESKALIGHISLLAIDWNVPRSEFGYYVDRHFYGQGLMTEALQRYCVFAFDELKLAKINLRIAPTNTASLQIARKCGFREVGLMRNDFKTNDGQLHDVILLDRVAG